MNIDQQLQVLQIIYRHFDQITNVESIDQLGFAAEAIRLISCGDKELIDTQKLNALVISILCALIHDYEVIAIPCALDFITNTQFEDKELIKHHDAIVDNKFYDRDVVIETHQKELVLLILRLVRNTQFNTPSLPKTKDNSKTYESLSFDTHTLQKLVVMFILKYVDIPFDEKFTDELIDTFLFLQTNPEERFFVDSFKNSTDQMVVQLWSKTHNNTQEIDREFRNFSQLVQDVIVSVHNYEVSSKLQTEKIEALKSEMKIIRDKILKHHQQNDNSSELAENNEKFDGRKALALAELVFKIRGNSHSESVRQDKVVIQLLLKIYKTLGYLIYDSHEVCVKVWHFSQKLFCIKWWNRILNRYHAEFVLSGVCRLKANRTTLYSVSCFSKVCVSIGDGLLDELQVDRSNDFDNPSKKLLSDMIMQIGEEYKDKSRFNSKLKIPGIRV